MDHVHVEPTKSWGRALWTFIHAICVIDLETPEQNLQECKQVIKILKNIQNVIPCETCRIEWKTNLTTLMALNPSDLQKPLSLFRWSWQVHNKVNKKTHKPTITYEQALQLHTKTQLMA